MAVLKYKANGQWYDLTIGDGGMDQATADARYVNIDGDNMTGALAVVDHLNIAGNGSYIYYSYHDNIFYSDGSGLHVCDGALAAYKPIFASPFEGDYSSGLHWSSTDRGVFSFSSGGTGVVQAGGWSGAGNTQLNRFYVVGQPPQLWLCQDGVAYVGIAPTTIQGVEGVKFLNSSGIPEAGRFGYYLEIVDATSPYLVLHQLGVVAAGARPEVLASYDGITIMNGALNAYGNLCYNAAYPGSARKGKAAIIDLYNCMDKVQRLRPIEFTTKYAKGEHQYLRRPGLMADEVVNVLPGLVHKDEKGTPVGLNYEGIIPVLVGAIQEQQAQIETLEARIAALEVAA